MIDDKFSWVQTHKEIVEYLKTKENSQKELIGLLKSAGIGPFNDRSEYGKNDLELEEIDPFTFFCYIYKYGSKRRLSILQKIAEKLELSIPLGESGIPSTQPQKVWLFPNKYLRINNEIKRLWDLFYKELNNEVTDEYFSNTLKIKGVGKTKLTEALFYINPENNLPINGPTKPYLREVLSINPKFNSYAEYKEILEQVRERTDKPFYEISYNAWKWNNDRKKINYWIFQGNPKVFDFETALRENILTDWTVSAHKDKIKVGDKVILWITGNKSGVYALAEINSGLYPKKQVIDNHLWKKKDKNELKAGLKILYNMVDNPILKEEIEEFEELDNLKVGHQGTNFSATEEEYETILSLAVNKTGKANTNQKQYWLYSPGQNARKWHEFYEKGIMGLGWDSIGDIRQYKSREEIRSALVNTYGGTGSKKNDVSANDDFINKMKVGDIVIVKKGRSELLGYGEVTTEYFYDETRSEYQKLRKVNWLLEGSWALDFNLVLKTLTDITQYKSEDPNYEMYYENLLSIMHYDEVITKPKEEPMKFSLNTILYGPPGTGKTYNTILRAAEIVENRTIESYDEALEIFKANLHNRIEFITFHQNYSYEDFIQGLRPDTENDNQLTFERKDGVFKQIADKALKNLKDSKEPVIPKKSFEEAFSQFINPLTEGEVNEIEVQMKKVSFYITSVNNRSIEFRKSAGVTEHTLSLNTLSRMYSAESVLEIQGLAPYYSPLLKELLKIGKDTTGKKEKVNKKNYVIIIDEINRANISRVFGELITLIEPDKRSDGVIALEARLPSGDPFMVPSNLYIIGTMNTADKSIALLDIALRRRFEFESMYPLYEIKGEVIYDVEILKKINERIISTKGHDFQIGHSYFMGEENKELAPRMNKKVIPLLLEYYMNDEKEVKSILQAAGLKIEDNSWPLKIVEQND